jgi:hypothetical protein
MLGAVIEQYAVSGDARLRSTAKPRFRSPASLRCWRASCHGLIVTCAGIRCLGTSYPGHRLFILALFVHRVDGLAPGFYMLARDSAKVALLKRAMHEEFAWTLPLGCPEDLPLFLLEEGGDVRKLAAQVSCHQDIAGGSAFSLGMIAEFESSLRRYGPWFYRRLFWESGVIGQVLVFGSGGGRCPCDGNRLLF